MSLYAADGSWNVTVVDGSVYTGLHASDGSVNIIKSPGSSYVGSSHPCGALYVTISTPGTFTPIRAPDGSLYITDTGGMPATDIGQPVTVVSGTLHPVVGYTPTYYIYGF